MISKCSKKFVKKPKLLIGTTFGYLIMAINAKVSQATERNAVLKNGHRPEEL